MVSDFDDPTYQVKLLAEYSKYYTHPNFIYLPPNNSEFWPFQLPDIPLICNKSCINNQPSDHVHISTDNNLEFIPNTIITTTTIIIIITIIPHTFGGSQ